jgi:hypothetical protein
MLVGGMRRDLLDVVNADERGMVNEGPLAQQFIGQHLCPGERRGETA